MASGSADPPRTPSPEGVVSDDPHRNRDQRRNGRLDRRPVAHYGQNVLWGGTVNVCDGKDWAANPGAPTCERCRATFRQQLKERF